MGQGVWTLLVKGWIVFRKDVQLEFRSRFALNAILMFAVTTLTAVSFSVGGIRLEARLLAPFLWIVLFFSAMSGLAHIFVREEEQQTADTLRLLFPPNAVWLGKWFFNLVLLFGLELIIIPLYVVMMDVAIARVDIFLLVLIIGSIGLASVSTIIAAIISLASSRGALFAVLAFPIALPVLLTAIRGSRLALEGTDFSNCLSVLQVLISFTVIIVTASLMLFEFVWRK